MKILQEELSKLSNEDREAFFAYCMLNYKDDFTRLFRDWLYSFDIADLESNISKAESAKKDEENKDG